MTQYEELVKRLRAGCDSEFDGECALSSDDARKAARAIEDLTRQVAEKDREEAAWREAAIEQQRRAERTEAQLATLRAKTLEVTKPYADADDRMSWNKGKALRALRDEIGG